MSALIVALRIVSAGLLAYGLMRVVLRRLDPARVDPAQHARIASGVGLAAAAGVIAALLI